MKILSLVFYCFMALGCLSAYAREDSDACSKLKGQAYYTCVETREKDALSSMPYKSEQYNKGKLICSICDDIHYSGEFREEQGFGSPYKRRPGEEFTNPHLSDDLQRYRVKYGEHFQIKRCKEQETKKLCHTIKVISAYHARKAKDKKK